MQRSTYTLLSTGPTTTLWISIPVASQMSVSAMLTSVCRCGGWTVLDRRILAIAVPALGSLLVEPIYVLTDTAVVGRIGTDELGGLALASTVLNTLVLVFNFLSYGTTVRVAVRRGRGDLAGGATRRAPGALAGRRASGSWWPRGIALAAQPLVDLLGHDPAVIDHGVTYLRISTMGIPFQLVTIACIGYLYGLPDTRRPFLVLAASVSLNLGRRAAARVRARLGGRRQRARAPCSRRCAAPPRCSPSSCPASGPTGCTGCGSCLR